MAIFSPGLLIRNGSKNNNPLMLIFLVASLVVIVVGQSSWQDVTTFHPYCRQLFRSCVESSSIEGVGSGDYNVAVGICGNKMAICTFSGTLTWPWSSNIGSARPASASVDATPRLTIYQNVLTSSANVTPIPWQNLTDFLPDCRAEFRRCVNNSLLTACGHGMSVCTQRQGRWPYGNDSSAFWQQPYTNDQLTLYWNVNSGTLGSARSWQSLTVFLPLCRNLLTQCVTASGGASSNTAVGNCGNRMAICTSENIFWPHTYDASSANTESYDARWQRYANVINPISRWQDVTRFSTICIDQYFQCVYGFANVAEHIAFGVCGNYMSICTFNENTWPNASQVPTTFDSYGARLGIYRAMSENMLLRSPLYFTYPPVQFGLYPFLTHTFTSAGATGRFGPTLQQCRSAYSSQSWAQNSSFFDMTTQGIQLWTVPDTGAYRITCASAQGGTSWGLGGRGAQMRGDFNLMGGQILAILVGQQGGVRRTDCNAGGGGGSFVWSTQSASEPFIAAGGGGGGSNSAGGTLNGLPGSTTTAGTGTQSGRTAGSNGMGAIPGGAGWKSNGAAGYLGHNQQCLRPLEGGLGGSTNVTAVTVATVGDGGFGGGASASGEPCTNGGSGGGGGYSGGAGPSTNNNLAAGGGGGSYNSGTNQENLGDARLGDGFVTITRL